MANRCLGKLEQGLEIAKTPELGGLDYDTDTRTAESHPVGS